MFSACTLPKEYQCIVLSTERDFAICPRLEDASHTISPFRKVRKGCPQGACKSMSLISPSPVFLDLRNYHLLKLSLLWDTFGHLTGESRPGVLPSSILWLILLEQLNMGWGPPLSSITPHSVFGEAGYNLQGQRMRDCFGVYRRKYVYPSGCLNHTAKLG